MHSLLDQLLLEMDAAVGELDAAQTQLRPVKDKTRWSVQQGMEHLLLTYESSCKVFETRLGKGRPTLARPTFFQRMARGLVLGCGYLPHGQRSPVAVMPPEVVVPASGEGLVARARAVLQRLEELAGELERRFGEERSATHFALGPLTTVQWQRFHLVHGRHHLRQIRAIRRGHGV